MVAIELHFANKKVMLSDKGFIQGHTAGDWPRTKLIVTMLYPLAASWDFAASGQGCSPCPGTKILRESDIAVREFASL